MPIPRLEDMIEMRGFQGYYRWYHSQAYPKGRAFRTFFKTGVWTVALSRFAVSPLNHLANCITARGLGPKHMIDIIKCTTIPHMYPALGRTIPSNILSLTATESLKYYWGGNSLTVPGSDEKQSYKSLFYKNFFAGALGCIIPTIMFYPLESSQRHCTIDMGFGAQRYHGVTHCLEKRYIASEGKNLFKAMSASLFGTIIHRGFLFSFFELGRAKFITDENNPDFADLLTVALVASAAAGLTVLPFDAWRMTFYYDAYSNWLRAVRPWSYIRKVRVRTLLFMAPAIFIKSVGPALTLALFHRFKKDPASVVDNYRS